jgi:integrase
VLSADEVVQFLGAVPSLKSRAALTTAYMFGFRASEAAGLRIEDIDSVRGVIHVLGTWCYLSVRAGTKGKMVAGEGLEPPTPGL